MKNLNVDKMKAKFDVVNKNNNIIFYCFKMNFFNFTKNCFIINNIEKLNQVCSKIAINTN